MKVAIVSSEEGTSATELTLGLLRDILASGMGKHAIISSLIL